MGRVLLPVILGAALVGCSSSKARPRGPARPPECACRGHASDEDADGCGCPHCMSEETGMEPAECPCARRGSPK